MKRGWVAHGRNPAPLVTQNLLLFMLNQKWKCSGFLYGHVVLELWHRVRPELVLCNANRFLLWFLCLFLLPLYLLPHVETMFSQSWLRTFLNHIRQSGLRIMPLFIFVSLNGKHLFSQLCSWNIYFVKIKLSFGEGDSDTVPTINSAVSLAHCFSFFF